VLRIATIGAGLADENFEEALKIRLIDQGLMSGMLELWFYIDKIL
jgi:hypothetical protein